MKHKTLVIANISILLCMASSIYATIVWDGETLNEWPAEAFPERQHSHKVLTKVTSTTTGLGIYASPKGVYTGLTLLVDFSDNSAVFTKQEVWNWLNQPGFYVNNCDDSIRDYYLDVSRTIRL
ncbi:MAG: hypothetical protein AUK31_05250 [Fibrobacteres bacterium CG2_30_45_31]|nr:MAG: hypothetical protein AUK31_05250 [Fibrobacteres bacterium CG2_30_45_31]